MGQQRTYRPRLGVNAAGGSAIFWGHAKPHQRKTVLFENDHRAGRITGPQIGWSPVERELLYPFAKGRDIHRWRVSLSERVILVPHTADSGMKAVQRK